MYFMKPYLTGNTGNICQQCEENRINKEDSIVLGLGSFSPALLAIQTLYKKEKVCVIKEKQLPVGFISV